MIETTSVGEVTVLGLAHGKANALDTELLRALENSLAAAAASHSAAVVITGAGTFFSAGVDLIRLLEGGRPYLEDFLPALSSCFRELFLFPKPAIAAVNGHAIAGGCILACACDRRFMARGAGRIGVPELRVGVPFPLVPLEIMRFAVPGSRVSDIVLSGRNYEADAARDAGLVDEVVEPGNLVATAVAAARDLASIPSAIFRRTKHDLRRPIEETWQQHGVANDRDMLDAWGSDAVRRAVANYVEKTLGKRPLLR